MEPVFRIENKILLIAKEFKLLGISIQYIPQMISFNYISQKFRNILKDLIAKIILNRFLGIRICLETAENVITFIVKINQRSQRNILINIS